MLPEKEIPQIPFEVLFDKAHDLHPAFNVIIRAEHFLSGKIQEHSYKRMTTASKKIDELIQEHDITIVTDDFVGQVVPKLSTDFDDEFTFWKVSIYTAKKAQGLASGGFWARS